MANHEQEANKNMKQFPSLEKIDTAILYALELTSSVSVLLLAFGLIVSMANVLTEGSVLLLFTAAIVSNIESVQQTLNLTLNAAYQHVFIPVEALIWIRSIVIILLIVAHALRQRKGRIE